MTDQLHVELEGGTLLLKLNRPEKMNALTPEMVIAWTDALVRARTDSAVRVVVVTGEGRAFCAGGDLGRMATGANTSAPEKASGTAEAAADELENFVFRVAVAMDDLDKPVIAAVNGPAVGAGLGMALMADLRFLSDRARVSEGYINVGLFPGDGDTYFLPRVVGTSRALMMFWTGDFVSADECLSIGLADRVIPHDELMAETMAFAERLATRSQVALRAVKRATYASSNMNLRDSLGMIRGYCKIVNNSPERQEAYEAFMASRSKGAKDRG